MEGLRFSPILLNLLTFTKGRNPPRQFEVGNSRDV
jgi:hypothetical protein